MKKQKMARYFGVALFLFFVGLPLAQGSSCGTAQDSDGNTYDSVSINGQCWMTTNMKVGTKLSSATINPTNNGVIEKWCYDSSDGNCNAYGGLYGWREAMKYSTASGSQGICPANWHIPTDDEIFALTSYLTDSGQSCVKNEGLGCIGAGTKMKVGGSSGLNFPMGGYRYALGDIAPYDKPSRFESGGADAVIWSSSDFSDGKLWFRQLSAGYAGVVRTKGATTNPADLVSGMSVRCICNTANCFTDNGCAANTCTGATCFNDISWVNGTKVCTANINGACSAVNGGTYTAADFNPLKIFADPDGNGTINTADSGAALNAAVGNPSICTLPTCDVDKNGTININDALSILKMTTGQTPSKFCTAGIQTNLSGSGPWNWSCVGSGTGSTATCSAKIPYDCSQCSSLYSYSWTTFQSNFANCSDVIAGTPAYSLNCGCGARASDPFNFTPVCAPAPTLTYSTSPTSVVAGSSSTMTWSTTNATSCWASGGWSGWIAAAGTQSVTPASTTSYDIECWNSVGVSTGIKTATVTVTPFVCTPGTNYTCVKTPPTCPVTTGTAFCIENICGGSVPLSNCPGCSADTTTCDSPASAGIWREIAPPSGI